METKIILFSNLETCEIKIVRRKYATPKRHIQNLRKVLRNLQKIKKGVNTPRLSAFH